MIFQRVVFSRFVIFVTYGPFSEPNDRLGCFETINSSPSTISGGSSKGKAEILQIKNGRSNDENNQRGFTRDQNISIEALKLQQLAHG